MAFLHKIKDSDIQLAISKVLRNGVYLAIFFSVIGGIIFIYRHGSEQVGSHYKVFAEKDESFAGYMKDMFHELGDGHGRAFIKLGIIVLLATPTVRIIFSLLGYILEKDRIYISITIIVLLIICASVIGGWG